MFATCSSGHRAAARCVDHQAAQRLELGALLGDGSRNDIDEIDAVAHLRDVRPR